MLFKRLCGCRPAAAQLHAEAVRPDTPPQPLEQALDAAGDHAMQNERYLPSGKPLSFQCDSPFDKLGARRFEQLQECQNAKNMSVRLWCAVNTVAATSQLFLLCTSANRGSLLDLSTAASATFGQAHAQAYCCTLSIQAQLSSITIARRRHTSCSSLCHPLLQHGYAHSACAPLITQSVAYQHHL